MATNQNDANSKLDLEKVTKSIDAMFEHLKTPGSIQEVLNITRTAFASKTNVQIRPMLSEMVNNIDRPLLKGMAQDVVTVMSNWFEDPQTLCCLVQGIFSAFNVSTDQRLQDTDFGTWLDIIIAFLDIVIVLLTSNLKKLSLAIPDFLKEIMTGVVGGIILVLQEILFAIRDSLINELLKIFNDATKEGHLWAKCLPLVELIEILRKYINDYGLFAKLFEMIRGRIGELVGDFGYMKALDFPKNVKDLMFLYWFRGLLIKMKEALISFDLCFIPQTNAIPDPELSQITGALGTGGGSTYSPVTGNVGIPKAGNPALIQGINVTPDGTILEDKTSLFKNSVSVLTNSSVRGFLNKYYGYPLDVVDALIVGASSKDSVQGTLNGGNLDLNADCPNAPSPAETLKWALRVRNRNI